MVTIPLAYYSTPPPSYLYLSSFCLRSSLPLFTLLQPFPTCLHLISGYSYLSSHFFTSFLPLFTLLHPVPTCFKLLTLCSPASPSSYLLQVTHPLFTCFTQFLSLFTLLHCFLPTSPHPYLSPLHPASLPLSTLFLPASTFSTSLHLLHFLSLFILLHPRVKVTKGKKETLQVQGKIIKCSEARGLEGSHHAMSLNNI